MFPIRIMMLLKRTAKLLEIVQEVNFQKLLLIYVRFVNQVSGENFVWFSNRVDIQENMKQVELLIDFQENTWLRLSHILTYSLANPGHLWLLCSKQMIGSLLLDSL